MDALEFHRINKGKIQVNSKARLDSSEVLSLAYTPGVATVCLEIKAKPETVYDYTLKSNFVAIVTDCTRVLGLGDIGAEAGLPVMEGKAALFNEFGGVDAIPLALATRDKQKIIETAMLVEPNFGAINLEDIESPKVFEIYDELKSKMKIPVFHDDRHGTGVVVVAGLINALKVVGKGKEAQVVLVGAGAAAKGAMELLLAYGMKNITVLDSRGVLDSKRTGIEEYKQWFIQNSKPRCAGRLADAMNGADVVIATSAVPGLITAEMVKSMAKGSIIFALSNPRPEIEYEVAKEAGATVVATGRSDFPNQVNNVLAFPGIFRGTMDVRASEINTAMMIAAAEAIAACVEKPNAEMIMPLAYSRDVAGKVALATAMKAIESGIARDPVSEAELMKRINERIRRAHA